MDDELDPITRNPTELVIELRRQGITDDRVLDAMARIPRQKFVPDHLQDHAWANMALPIDEGQTISQPFIVALMTQALHLHQDARVLEIGTGSGYQAAILSQLCDEVISLERHIPLATSARLTLANLGISNVHIHICDGSFGWPGEAPYDGILVTAGAPHVPTHLIAQLREDGGRLVIPVGAMDAQQLVAIERRGNDQIHEDLGGVRFVPLIGGDAWDPDVDTALES